MDRPRFCLCTMTYSSLKTLRILLQCCPKLLGGLTAPTGKGKSIFIMHALLTVSLDFSLRLVSTTFKRGGMAGGLPERALRDLSRLDFSNRKIMGLDPKCWSHGTTLCHRLLCALRFAFHIKPNVLKILWLKVLCSVLIAPRSPGRRTSYPNCWILEFLWE